MRIRQAAGMICVMALLGAGEAQAAPSAWHPATAPLMENLELNGRNFSEKPRPLSK
jgi:hypothetical protein